MTREQAAIGIIKVTRHPFLVAVTIGVNLVETRNWVLDHVMAKGLNASNGALGIFAPSPNCDGGEMTDVTATASGSPVNTGIEMHCGVGSVTASNLAATANDGILATGLVLTNVVSVTARNSSFAGATRSVHRGSGTLKVISSELDGDVVGAVICVGDYDETGAALEDGTFGVGNGCL